MRTKRLFASILIRMRPKRFRAHFTVSQQANSQPITSCSRVIALNPLSSSGKLGLRWFRILLALVFLVTFPLSVAAQTQLPATTQASPSASQGLATPNASSAGSSVVTIDPNQLVLNAIHYAVWSAQPIACKVHQKSLAYDQLVIVSGEYKASGAGTGQFRYTARVSSGETTLDTIQVSDGRLMHTQIGVDEPPKRVIIDQVRQSLGNTIHYADERPEVSMYLAIGGHAELLRNLYHRYIWYAAKAGTIDGVDVWQLVGRLRNEPPKFAGNAPIDQGNINAPPAGSNVPSEVRLTLGRSAVLPYFPYCVEYFKRVPGEDGKTMVAKAVSKLVYSEPTATTVSDKDFVYRVPENVVKIDTATALYLPTTPFPGQIAFPVSAR